MVTVIIIAAALPFTAMAEPTVKVSEIEYNVNVGGANAYLCNLKPIEGKVGDEMYITYTVKSAVFNKPNKNAQQAVVGTDQSGIMWPYEEGGLIYYKNGDDENLLKVGFTYFMKFVVTEDGFDFWIGRAKGDFSEVRRLVNKAGSGTDTMKYFGLYLDGGQPSVSLTNVHVYDKDGKDLGVGGRNASAVRVYDAPVAFASQINHTYDITVENGYDITIRNKMPNRTGKMFIEYTCADYSVPEGQKGFYQTGIKLNHYVTGANYQLRYTNKLTNGNLETPEQSDLLVVGAKYLIMMENTETDTKGWDVTIQRTFKGKTEWFKFQSQVGSAMSTNNGYSSLLFGESHLYRGSFKLENLKIYDGNYKHLGAVVGGSGSFTSTHTGEYISYAGCDTLYYCEANETFIAVYPDQTIDITKGEVTKSGTYTIEDSVPGVLTAKIGGEKQEFGFYHTYMTDADKNEYQALTNYKLSFVTGTSEEISEQSFSAELGYKPTKPEDPKLEGDEFLGWVTADGKDFDFNTIMTKSVTLYANWKNSGKTFKNTTVAEPFNATPYVAIGLSVFLVAGAVGGSFFIISKFRM